MTTVIEIVRAGADDLPALVRLFEAETRDGEYPQLARYQEAWVAAARRSYDSILCSRRARAHVSNGSAWDA